jgi:DNA polymerase-3 subunit delta
MGALKAHEVDAWLRRPSAEPVVLVYGPDRGLVSERAATLAKAWGVALDDPFSAIRLDASEIESDPPRLADEARTVSMFGGKRLVWVRGSGGPKLAAAVADLCSAPPKDTLILIEGGDLKKDSGLRKTAEKSASAITLPCYADEGRNLDGLIDEVMGANRLSLDMEARQWLKTRLGGDRLASRGELDKLALYALGKGRIALDDAQASIGDVSGLSIDAVVDAVLTGDMNRLDTEFSKFTATKTPSSVLLVMLARQMQNLLPLREQIEAGGQSAGGVIAGLKPPLFGPKKTAMETMLSAWTVDTLGRALERVADTVLESRRRAALEDEIIRQALFALASGARRASSAGKRWSPN